MRFVNARVILGASVLLAIALAVAGAVVVGSSSAHPPQPRGSLVAFYGDSYTRGAMASSPAKRWSTIVCRDHGWREFNPSVSGLGFVHNRRVYGQGDLPDQIIRQHPDIVIVTLGLNDNFAYPVAASAIHKQIGADLRRMKTALPRARFVVVEPFWYTDARPASVGIIAGWVKAAAADIGADYIPGASHWIEHHPEWMASDHLHPNDIGYARIASRMDAALMKLGL
ncbi:SGNH/GDSL hydrolase family protein [Lacisediminihabitans profunda]|uniref:SGNH/GDSL hydrolase family protein n=1 Tax=Lacisediminihabitans profunda TaxID=2594790 RepID=A0A5C8UXS4_9MICO|nr:SGNH/GDSL hydrolase family protein [Lacisediminihabitans profunda]TXN32479.1 SGNH/GDSL hydrolase family protein [Lacisediminihabitans profunda]